MKGMKIVTVNVEAYSLHSESHYESIRTRSQREVDYYTNQKILNFFDNHRNLLL